jgi:hypothetical protein
MTMVFLFFLLLYPRLRWLLSAMTMAFLCCTAVPPPPLAALSDDDGPPLHHLRCWMLKPLTVLLLTPLTASVPPTAPLSLHHRPCRPCGRRWRQLLYMQTLRGPVCLRCTTYCAPGQQRQQGIFSCQTRQRALVEPPSCGIFFVSGF